MSRTELPFDSAVATGRGDDGSTGLLFGGERIRKDDLRTEAYGTVDEVLLDRLARDITAKGTGLGEHLLLDALFRSYHLSDKII